MLGEIDRDEAQARRNRRFLAEFRTALETDDRLLREPFTGAIIIVARVGVLLEPETDLAARRARSSYRAVGSCHWPGVSPSGGGGTGEPRPTRFATPADHVALQIPQHV